MSNEEDLKESAFSAKQPQYQMTIGDAAYFQEKLDEVINDGNIIKYGFETRQDYIGPILSWLLPIFILVAIWLFIMKRVSGGGGPGGGQIFNIGKSKATLFDNKSTLYHLHR